MREDALSQVLLIKAVEESDRDGMLLAPADRAAATREASRAGSTQATPPSGALAASAQRVLATRAAILRERLVARFPVVDTVLALARGPRWIAGVLLVIAVATGFALSALDGTRRINVLAFPLFGLVAWNLAVYALLVVRWIRAAARGTPPQPPLARWIARAAQGRLQRLVASAGRIDAPLAVALARFGREWFDAAKPLLVARATRLFHLCAAAVGIGLIAGLYLRGVVLDYRAGWESTLLEPAQVHRALSIAYGPASRLTGIAVPDAERLAAIRFAGDSGGESAAPWLHLLAATALLFVVLPRLALALVGSVAVWRRSRFMPLPPAIAAYFRAVAADAGMVAARGSAAVIPYAYEPTSSSTAALARLLSEALGAALAVDIRPAVRYGDEEALLRNLADRDAGLADAVVLLFSLSSTPEDENHGSVIAGVRDHLARSARHAQLLLLVDERPYAQRMSAQGAHTSRVDERRALWREFTAARGLRVGFVDLDPSAAASAGREAAERLRAALSQPAS